MPTLLNVFVKNCRIKQISLMRDSDCTLKINKIIIS